MADDIDAELVVKAWAQQLLGNDLLLDAIADGGQVEVRLFTHQGKVRKEPVIALNAGPNAMVNV